MKHLLNAADLTESDISEIFALTDKMANTKFAWDSEWEYKGKILGSLFFEPSTRTRWSTEAAMIRLGGEVLSMEYAKESSSDRKGESLRDTIKTCSQYVDALVVRHPVENSIQEAAPFSDVPVINGGDGSNEHPTQALLDLYTIVKHFAKPFDEKIEFKHLEDKRIMFTGDLDCSRTVHSLIKLLRPYSMRVSAEGPTKFNNPHGSTHYFYETDLYQALPIIDVLYMTRHQKERSITGPGIAPRPESPFVLTRELSYTMKKDAIIMHPLPRTKELPPEVDANPRAKYFKQAKNGMWIRMALLRWLLA